MLPKKNRIPRAQFDTYFRQSKVIRSKSFTVRIGKLDKDQETQAAVVVSKKVAKKATERHTIKRRIYSVIAKLLPTLPHSSIIVITQKGGDWNYASLEAELTQALGSK